MAGIDFIKFAVHGEPAKALMADPRINPKRLIDSNGEVLSMPTAKVAGLKSIWFNNHSPETVTKAIISLCLPEYCQGNNYINLDYKTQQRALKRLINEFGIPSDAPIISFEFGFNLKPPFSTTEFLNHVAYHNGQRFYPEMNKNKHLARCEHERYFLKLYDKAMQHNLPYPLLRIEMQIKRMEHLKALGIKTLSDVSNGVKIKGLQQMLYKAATEMVILDYRLWSEALTPKESILRNQFCRRETWETIADDRDKIRRTKQRLHLLSNKYYPTTIGQQFVECVAAANHQFWLS